MSYCVLCPTAALFLTRVGYVTDLWSFFQCNVPCGDGTQRRDIICVQKMGNDFTVVPDAECAKLDKPASVQQCKIGACQAQWFTTEWSAVRDERTTKKTFLKIRDLWKLYLYCWPACVFVLSAQSLVERAYR